MQVKELERKRKEAQQYMALPYEAKVGLAETRIMEWRDECRKHDKNYHVSVGGLDSITLLYLVRKTLGDDVPAISISALEDKSI